MQTITCMRCPRAWGGNDQWMTLIEKSTSHIAGVVCPNCVTDSERAQANADVLAGKRYRRDAFGRSLVEGR